MKYEFIFNIQKDITAWELSQLYIAEGYVCKQVYDSWPPEVQRHLKVVEVPERKQNIIGKLFTRYD